MKILFLALAAAGFILWAALTIEAPAPLSPVSSVEAQVCTPTGWCRPTNGPACCSKCKLFSERCPGTHVCADRSKCN